MSAGHSDATYEQAEAGFAAGIRWGTHLFNAMRGFHHREPGLAGFGLMDDDLYVEVIADMAHLHVQSLKMVLEMKRPERILLISDSVKGPGWGKGPIRGPGGVLEGSGVPLMDQASLAGAVKKNCVAPTHKFFDRFGDFERTAQAAGDEMEGHVRFLRCELFRYVRQELARRKRRRNLRSYDDLLADLRAALRAEAGGALLRRHQITFAAIRSCMCSAPTSAPLPSTCSLPSLPR